MPNVARANSLCFRKSGSFISAPYIYCDEMALTATQLLAPTIFQQIRLGLADARNGQRCAIRRSRLLCKR
jgi:hypothetical protein